MRPPLRADRPRCFLYLGGAWLALISLHILWSSGSSLPDQQVHDHLGRLERKIDGLRHTLTILAASTAGLAAQATAGTDIDPVGRDTAGELAATPLAPSSSAEEPSRGASPAAGAAGQIVPPPLSSDEATMLSWYSGLNAWPKDPKKGDVDKLSARLGGVPLGCSEGTYGEILFPSLLRVFAALALSGKDSFIDIGSGVGKNVLAALHFGKVRRSTGVEFSRIRWETSCAALHAFADGSAGDAMAVGSSVDMIQADATTLDVSEYTVAFLLSTCFRPSFMNRLTVQLRRMKVGSRVATAQLLPHGFAAAPLAGARRTMLAYERSIPVVMTWTQNSLMHLYRVVLAQDGDSDGDGDGDNRGRGQLRHHHLRMVGGEAGTGAAAINDNDPTIVSAAREAVVDPRTAPKRCGTEKV